MHAFIGLGSNLDHPSQRLISDLRALQRLPGLTLCHHSRLYASAPVGPRDQPDYVNAVADIDTPLSPHALLHTLQALELAAGRQRLRHWGERTLDLDILLIGDSQWIGGGATASRRFLGRRIRAASWLLKCRGQRQTFACAGGYRRFRLVGIRARIRIRARDRRPLAASLPVRCVVFVSPSARLGVPTSLAVLLRPHRSGGFRGRFRWPVPLFSDRGLLPENPRQRRPTIGPIRPRAPRRVPEPSPGGRPRG